MTSTVHNGSALYTREEYSDRYCYGILPRLPDPARVFHVSASAGDDSNPGTRDLPFRTLEAARDAIRRLKKSQGLPSDGVHVVLDEGDYHLTTPFALLKEDSGTCEAPIVYRGAVANAESVRISGGLEIDTSGMKPVSDAVELARLKPSARGNVMAVKLPAEAKNYFPGDGEYGMISMGGYLLTLAQWPNVGYHHFGEILEKGPTTRWLKPGESPAPYSKENPAGGKFTFKEHMPSLIREEFARSGDMQAEGFFHNDWYFQQELVGGITGEVVQLLRYTRYGLENKITSMPRRVRLVNVLAELDRPGEWYYDRIDNKLFVWPIDGFMPGMTRVYALGGKSISRSSLFQDYSGEINQTASTDALVTMENTSFVTFRNMTFENTGDLAVSIAGGEHNLIAGCSVRNGLNKGIAIDGGTHNGIAGCDIYGLEAAFSISGGDFKALDRCYNFAVNNDIHGCRRRGYGMINLDGVGLYFAHNVLHDMNGAVNYKTVDTLLEYNEFYNIGYEMGDFNVAYCGAVWYTMGNVVRFNFVHHLLEPGGYPICGFRNDDGGAGMTLYGNVFYRSGRGAAQFAGPLNRLENNIAMDCNIFWWTNKRPIDAPAIALEWKNLESFGRDLPRGDKGDNIFIMEQIMGKKGWMKSPWIDEYPQLAEVIATNPWAQTLSVVDRNYYANIDQLFHIHGGGGDIEGLENPETAQFVDLPDSGVFRLPHEIDMSVFADVSTLNFNFKSEIEPMAGFDPIPFDTIGLIADQYRPAPPDREQYRKQIFEKFVNDKGGDYDVEKVNARYPVPSYLK